MNNRSIYFPRMFFAAAVWNWIAGLGLLFGAGAMRAMTGAAAPFDPLGKQLFASLVLVFGLGYYIVSRDVSRNEGIVVLGIVGKLTVIALFTIHAALGRISWALAAPVAVDAVFAALFAGFLWSRGRAEAVASAAAAPGLAP